MKRYILEYKFSKLSGDPASSSVEYSAYDSEESTWLEKSAFFSYTPRAFSLETHPVDAMNDLNNRIRQVLRARLRDKYGSYKNFEFRCLNPKSDFLTRSERIRITKAKKAASVQIYSEPIAFAAVEPKLAVAPEKRLYEVCQKNGVWTIIRHEQELLTEQEAKTQLFAHHVNGD